MNRIYRKHIHRCLDCPELHYVVTTWPLSKYYCNYLKKDIDERIINRTVDEECPLDIVG